MLEAKSYDNCPFAASETSILLCSMTSKKESLTWLVTGCSGGIGIAIVRHVLSQGHRVIATSRNLSKTPDLIEEVEGNVDGRWTQLDTSWSSEDIQAKLIEAWSMFPSGIDVVVNNAGMDVLGAIEDIPEAEAKSMFEVNFWGLLRVCKSVIPLMREKGSGTIVNVSSALGMNSWPGVAMYSTTKWAVEGESADPRLEQTLFDWQASHRACRWSWHLLVSGS
jgi:NAD(P)-dependent dehydrogenase (short-subunit alcohol dehydrogenase family)